MLALDPHYLDCTVYMYPSEKDAQQGTRVGGSGVMVVVPSRHPPKHYHHVVTNRHVIDAGNYFIRFNHRLDGEVVIMRTEPADWVVSTEDDLAAIGFAMHPRIKWVAISTDVFLDERCEIEGWPIFPGDEVFFYGRFIEHDGKHQRNKPVMRFGNVAMLADNDVPINMGVNQQVGFLVECRSLSGFSGSPAFVKLSDARLLEPEHDRDKYSRMKISPNAIRLLGVDCGHFPFWSKVREATSMAAATYPNMHVETNSGIAIVIPAWRLLRLLNEERLMNEREAIERKLDEKASAVIPDVADEKAANTVFTKDDFLDALKRVSQKQPDEGKA